MGLKNMYENIWAVVCDSPLAFYEMSTIEKECGKEIAEKSRSTSDMYTRFTDGTVLRWVPPDSSVRGFRFGKVWCDRQIDDDAFKQVVLAHYFGRREDIVWV